MAIRRALRPPGRRGFTLVELLVAVGLTSLLLWGLLQLYTSATRFSAVMFTEAELVAGGRAVLDLMCRELMSAATRDVGYLKIADGGKSIQFVAPVGENEQLAHVKYYVDGSNVLHRALKEPVNDSDTQDTDPGQGRSLGVQLARIKIERIDETSSGEPQGGDKTYEKDTNPSDGIAPLPRAILIEVQVVDSKGQASITLSSGAFLGGGGI